MIISLGKRELIALVFVGFPVSILCKSISDRYRPDRNPITVQYRFKQNASWIVTFAIARNLFALPLSVIGRLCSVIVALLRHLHYCFTIYGHGGQFGCWLLIFSKLVRTCPKDAPNAVRSHSTLYSSRENVM